MSPPVTLYRFQISVSDVDRAFYESLDFRAAQHPSEAPIYLVTRVLALALSFEENLSFTAGGLSTPDEPAIKSIDANGGVGTWIDIGNPSARRVHKASKSAERVRIFTYKNPKLLLEELNSEHVHRAERIEIFSIAPEFLERLIAKLERQNAWQLIRNETSLMVSIGDETIQGEILKHKISSNF